MMIRTMSIDDYDAVYTLWMSCKNMGFNNLDDSREGINRFLLRNPNTVFVAEEEKKENVAKIAVMAVAEAYRRQGIAEELLKHSLKALEAEGIYKVALLVFNRNDIGNAFWEKQGFTVRKDITYRNKALAEFIRTDT